MISLGPWKVALLEKSWEEWSIAQTPRENHLSYRRPWEMVDNKNQCFKKPLVVSVTGGKGGGGAILTDDGEKIIQLYRKMEKKAEDATRAEGKFLQKLLLTTRRGAD